jgi:hypothetical protein
VNNSSTFKATMSKAAQVIIPVVAFSTSLDNFPRGTKPQHRIPRISLIIIVSIVTKTDTPAVRLAKISTPFGAPGSAVSGRR